MADDMIAPKEKDIFDLIVNGLSVDRGYTCSFGVLKDAFYEQPKYLDKKDRLDLALTEKEKGKRINSPDIQRIKGKNQLPGVKNRNPNHQSNNSDKTLTHIVSFASGKTINMSTNLDKASETLGITDGENKFRSCQSFEDDKPIPFFRKTSNGVKSLLAESFSENNAFKESNDETFDLTKVDTFLRSIIDRNDPETFMFTKAQLHDFCEDASADTSELQKFLSAFDAQVKAGHNILLQKNWKKWMTEPQVVADYVLRTNAQPQSPANKVRPRLYAQLEVNGAEEARTRGSLVNLADKLSKKKSKALKSLQKQNGGDWAEEESAWWDKHLFIAFMLKSGEPFKPQWLRPILKPNLVSGGGVDELYEDYSHIRQRVLDEEGEQVLRDRYNQTHEQLKTVVFESDVVDKKRPYKDQFSTYCQTAKGLPKIPKKFPGFTAFDTKEDIGISLDIIEAVTQTDSSADALKYANESVTDDIQSAFFVSLTDGTYTEYIKENPITFKKLIEAMETFKTEDIPFIICSHGQGNDGAGLGLEKMAQLYIRQQIANRDLIKSEIGECSGRDKFRSETFDGYRFKDKNNQVLIACTNTRSIVKWTKEQYVRQHDTSHTLSDGNGKRSEPTTNPWWVENAMDNERKKRENIHDGLKWLWEANKVCDEVEQSAKSYEDKQDANLARMNLETDFTNRYGPLKLPFEFNEFVNEYRLDEKYKEYYLNEPNHIMTIQSPEEIRFGSYREMVLGIWVKHS